MSYEDSDVFKTEQLKYNKISARASTWIAISAVTGIFLSTVSLFIAAYSIYFVAKTERIRLTPEVRLVLDHRLENILVLENFGSATAYLKEVTFRKENPALSGGYEYFYYLPDRESDRDLQDFLAFWASPTKNATDEDAQDPISGTIGLAPNVIRPGEKFELLSLNFISGDDALIEKTKMKISKRIASFFIDGGGVKLVYCSYDELVCRTRKF